MTLRNVGAWHRHGPCPRKDQETTSPAAASHSERQLGRQTIAQEDVFDDLGTLHEIVLLSLCVPLPLLSHQRGLLVASDGLVGTPTTPSFDLFFCASTREHVVAGPAVPEGVGVEPEVAEPECFGRLFETPQEAGVGERPDWTIGWSPLQRA